jgi:hypothetical protein
MSHRSINGKNLLHTKGVNSSVKESNLHLLVLMLIQHFGVTPMDFIALHSHYKGHQLTFTAFPVHGVYWPDGVPAPTGDENPPTLTNLILKMEALCLKHWQQCPPPYDVKTQHQY